MPDTASKILIADDNLQNCELLEAYLSDEPYEITMAFDGLEALAKVRESEPDLILLDIMMPKLSGFEVAKKLKQDPATRSIMILMVTALNELGDIERAVDAGTSMTSMARWPARYRVSRRSETRSWCGEKVS